ncbi:hypothetical protein ACIBOT_44970, partial [Nonomuraea wenchangensis]
MVAGKTVEAGPRAAGQEQSDRRQGVFVPAGRVEGDLQQVLDLEVDRANRTGHARYTYRLRVSSTALALLLAEWDRCRWVWNQCV